jgi:hypothetical protein
LAPLVRGHTRFDQEGFSWPRALSLSAWSVVRDAGSAWSFVRRACSRYHLLLIQRVIIHRT